MPHRKDSSYSKPDIVRSQIQITLKEKTHFFYLQVVWIIPPAITLSVLRGTITHHQHQAMTRNVSVVIHSEVLWNVMTISMI